MKTFLVAAALLVSGTAAYAQTPPPGEGPDGRRPDVAAHMEAHRNQELADLSVVLGLKTSQQPALQQWLDAMRPPQRRWHRDAATSEQKAAMTTPDRLAKDQARLADRQQFEATKIAATQHFYAGLDARQQQVFDALDRLRHDHGGHHGPHGGMGTERPGGRAFGPPPAPGT